MTYIVYSRALTETGTKRGQAPQRRTDRWLPCCWTAEIHAGGDAASPSLRKRQPPCCPGLHADGAGNDVAGSESEIVELVPGERIVLHWQFVGPDRTTDPAMATRLTVTFTPTPDGTQLDLTHDRLDGLRDRYPHIAEQVGPGWESALDALVAVGW